jgi:cytochrome c oxidase assembly protein subunit 15
VTRGLLALAFALALIVVGVTATMRLAANGIGCSPWPACYGTAATAEAADRSPLVRTLRLVHRLSATGFAAVALAVVGFGWRRWSAAARAAGVALLVVTVLLAVIGRHSPSPLPAITLANLLGGFALLALLAYLWVAATMPAAPTAAGATWRAGVLALAVAVLLQAASGGLISARLAGADCAATCGAAWVTGVAALANPLRPGSAAELVHPRAGQVLHGLHRLGGLALAVAAVAAVFTLVRWRSPRLAAAAMSAAAATGALGFAVARAEPALAAAASHALAAAVLFAVLGAALALPSACLRETPK